jgi:hypothetical protein
VLRSTVMRFLDISLLSHHAAERHGKSLYPIMLDAA